MNNVVKIDRVLRNGGLVPFVFCFAPLRETMILQIIVVRNNI
jgi:hypothetical protein